MTPEDILTTDNRIINNITPYNRLVSQQVDDSLQAALYTRYNIDSYEIRDQGRLAVPVATDGSDPTQPVVEILQLYAPQAMRVVEYDCSKQSNPPVVPTPVDRTSFGDVLLSTEVLNPLPRLSMEQQYMDYSQQGKYTYIQTLPRLPGTDPLPGAKYPFQLPFIQEELTTGQILQNAALGAAFGAAGSGAVVQGYGQYTGQQSSFFAGNYIYLDSVNNPLFYASDIINLPDPNA